MSIETDGGVSTLEDDKARRSRNEFRPGVLLPFLIFIFVYTLIIGGGLVLF